MSFVHSFVSEGPLDRLPLVASLVVIVGFLLGRRVCHGVRRLRGVATRLLILGDSHLARRVIEEIERRGHRRYVVVGVLGDAASLGRVIAATRPDRIVVALDDLRGRLPLHSLLESQIRGVLIEDAVEVYERLTGKLALEALRPSSLIFSREFRLSRFHILLSRPLSLIASIVGLIVLAPLFGLIMLVIKLDSRGPVFFVQKRVGLLGRSFRLIKFRTMDPVSRPSSEWERDNRDRITRAGQWLRRYRLDELPQLVNVFRGEMNLVGPRPHPVTNLGLMTLVGRNLSEVSGDAIPYYALRCAVRPGITGWAQVRYGYANTLDEEMEKIRYDFFYLKHMSLWLDLRILFETVRLVFSGRGVATTDDGRARRQRRLDAPVSARRA